MAGGTITGSYTSGITLTVNPTTVTSTGTINAYFDLKGHNRSWTIDNAGLLTASGSGIILYAGGVISNATGGTISSGATYVNKGQSAAAAIRIDNAFAQVVNSGLISGGEYGITFGAGGRVTNATGGTITAAARDAILIQGASGAVVNSSVVSSTNRDAVELRAGGSVINQSNATLSGATGVVISGNAGMVNNQGTIAGSASYGGVSLLFGGSVINGAGASITGGRGIDVNGAAGTVTNDGSIIGEEEEGVRLVTGLVNNQAAGVISGAYGVVVAAGGSVANSGLIEGHYVGVLIEGGPGTVTNHGKIVSAATVDSTGTVAGSTYGGVLLLAGGSVTNAAGALISSNQDFVISVNGAPGTVVNSGVVQAGSSAFGIVLHAGGSITNTAHALVSSGDGGLGGFLPVTILNQGTVDAYLFGIELVSGGQVTNAAGALIEARYGIVGAGGGTFTNAGTIISTSTAGFAVVFLYGYAGHLIVDPGAKFQGTVSGALTPSSSVVSTMELASGASTGVISGLGSQFINFGSITVDVGASWNIGGSATISAGETITDSGTLDFLGGLANTGVVIASGGTLFLTHGITGAGKVELKAHGVESVTNPAGGFLQFLDATDTIDLNTPASFHSLIQGFVKGDVIDLVNTTVTSLSYTSPNLTVKDGTTTEATLRFSGSFTQSSFTFTADGHGGTLIEHT